MRSYVLREGRLTAAQRRALDELLPKYRIALPEAITPEAINLAQLFGRDAPLHFEIGFGDGETLLAMAEQNPDCNFLGAEVHRPGVGRLARQLHARGIANVRIVCEDGVRVLAEAIAPKSLAALYVYFPDPWPKKRHHKRRLVQTPFARLVASRLAAGGHVYFATDWAAYAGQAMECLQQSPELQNCNGAFQFAARPAHRPPTKFERRAQQSGRAIWDIAMRKLG